MSDEIVSLLREIRDNQVAARFNVGTYVAGALALSFAFILGLAINSALTQTFALIPAGTGLLGAYIYMVVALVICVLFIFLIYIYLQPWLASKFNKPKKNTITQK